MKKYLNAPAIATVVLALLLAAVLTLLPKIVLAVAASALLFGFTGLYFLHRATVAFATFRTDDNIVKWLISAGVLDSTGFGYVETLTETHTAASFTDGGAAVGTKSFTAAVPKGAILIGSKLVVTAGFAGDVSATVTIGDGSDVDRYHTGTPNVFATAASGVETGVPSGNKLLVSANKPTITVTSNADFTPVLAGGGSMTISLYYIRTAQG